MLHIIHVMRIRKILISYVRLDHMLYSFLHSLIIHYLYSYVDLDSGTARVEKYKSVEPAYVDQVLKFWFWNGGLELNNEGRIISR